MKERQYANAFPAWHTGFVQVPNEILLDPELSAGAVRAWSLLLNLSTRNGGEIDPSLAEAAAMIGVSENGLRTHIKELVVKGLLTVKRRGQGMPNLYTVIPPGQNPGVLKRENCGSENAESVVPSIAVRSQELEDSSLRSETPTMPKLPRVNGRDLPLDVLAEVCGIDQANRTRMREAASALNGTQRDDGIKQLFWIEYVRWVEEDPERRKNWPDSDQGNDWLSPEALTHALVQMIRRKAALYRERFADAELTPSALRKWWLDLENKPAGGSVSGDDVRRGRA